MQLCLPLWKRFFHHCYIFM